MTTDNQAAADPIDELIRERVTVAHALREAAADVSQALRDVDRTRAKHAQAWKAARNAGWSDAELTKKLGITRPARRTSATPRKTRTKTKTTSETTTTMQSSSAKGGTSDASGPASGLTNK